ncbi:BON domain-containing protein [Halomonas sp. HL-93]|uniref:BON domain-containing protein n=1 Tax=Halomonas sp. HL-93 TaxID=1666906 RepID=UPI0006D98362|nr:BON domain-containing protein [Halomonas sp. HL-93]KPQ22164.1 MAG: putative periplasmic or secreted lipoprotein [Halomonas sp. HL-93]SBR49622.1 Osmotically-inducible protein OsmY, contains BON domain [Halomonas sp. HL-93]
MTLQLPSLRTSRLLMAAALGASILLAGCATNTRVDSSNYAQRSEDVAAVDATIEREVGRALERADGRLGDARIRPHSFNGIVLLVGQVPSEELREMAEKVTSDLRGVDEVHNELNVAARLPSTQRLTDTWLTSNVVSRLATNDSIDSSKLKVTTENASVYIMGMVSRDEAERIVNAASNVAGVQRIVKVFEYIDD